MTYKEMVDLLLVQRFGENKRDGAEQWVNMRYGMVWAAADWPFKKQEREIAAVDANGLVTMPMSFRRMLWVESVDEGIVQYLAPADFRRQYGHQNTETNSTPSVYTVNNGQAYVRPKGASQVYIAYDRSVCHLDLNGSVIAGVLSADTDEPIWDEEFHYVLVAGAMSSGLKAENDPTWDALEAEFTMLVQGMREEYLPPGSVENKQYGRIFE